MTIELVHNSDPTVAEDITAYAHCRRCLDELRLVVRPRKSPRSYARLNVGITKDGRIQVWCVRHNCNVTLISARLNEGVLH
jgi:hypothetical protein